MHLHLPLFLTTRVVAGTIELASRSSASDNDSAYSQSASSALTPLGYAAAFVNTDVLASREGYLEDFRLVDYDVNACAQRCNANKECVAFNIYFRPDHLKISSNGKTAAIKCALWSNTLSLPDTEIGSDVVAGSNAYNQEKALVGTGPGPVHTLPIKFPSVTQLGDTYYSVELTCNGQRLPVMLDTGSADLFLVSNECPNTPTSGCFNSTPFEIQPTTNMPRNQSFFTIVGTGPVFGNQSILDVQFGTKNIIARDLDVGLVYNAVQMEFQNGTFSGILGMGLRNVSRQFYQHQNLPPFDTLVAQKRVLAPKFSTLFPRYADPNSPKEGRLTIGGIDKEASNGQRITYSNIVDSPNYNYPGAPPAPQLWSITVDGMRFNGKTISLPASGIVSGSPYVAAIDSGTSFMAVGGIVFDQIANSIIGPSQSSGLVVSFDCSKPQHLEIKINGQWIDIKPLDLITPGDWFTVNETQMCRASVNAQSLSLADSILGVPFLRNVLAVFDYVSDDMYSVQPRIGIAPLTNWSLALEQYKLSHKARVGTQIPFPGF
ncbi:eukaryotic aspartyl protease [Fusarium subglutinans]|uniref:Eukaryotic aspartyl protease n=1 Tax=Gibberella subglutinans TaxID=42677 RepID=A0A8H5LDD9_GIBSU|nr:eukaryotic aspartyl protease [Fusarium subglutinans]KAF5588596.1 eukaryotic aspartyl protease [Fusarium subglutinans]